MFNDPLIGYYCDKSTRFEKWGKRFPFIMMGGIPWCFIIIFLFASPSVEQIGQIGVFFWLLTFLFLFDFLYSIFDVNRVALFPSKFRSDKQRKIGGYFAAIFITLGVMLGVIIPIVFVEVFGTETGWILQGVILAFIALTAIILMIPGVKEPPELRQRLLKKEKGEHQKFFAGMKMAIKDKNFMGYAIFQVAYSTTMGIMIVGMPWFVGDILGLSKVGELILLGYIIAVPITAPIWYKLSLKIGARKVLLIGAVLLACMGLPLLFVPSGSIGFIFALVIITTAGLVDGAIESMVLPIFSSVVDKKTIEKEKSLGGLYRGVEIFFIRLGIFIRTLLLLMVQIWFNYVPRQSTAPSELLGLRLYMSVFPMIIMSLGILAFVTLYKITQEELDRNLDTIEELNL